MWGLTHAAPLSDTFANSGNSHGAQQCRVRSDGRRNSDSRGSALADGRTHQGAKVSEVGGLLNFSSEQQAVVGDETLHRQRARPNRDVAQRFGRLIQLQEILTEGER